MHKLSLEHKEPPSMENLSCFSLGKKVKSPSETHNVPDNIVQEITRTQTIVTITKSGLQQVKTNKILKGEKSEFNTPFFSQLATKDLPPLPLPDVMRPQLSRLLRQTPVSVAELTLMDVLGLTIHNALSFLSQTTREEKQRKNVE